MEKWKAIEDFEAYEVSNLGRVRRRLPSRTSKVGKQLNTTFHTNSGYVTLVLRKAGKSYTKNLHRLVAKAFVSNPQNLPQVNHKDGNKDHNEASNLEWRSNIGNMRHSTQIGIVPLCWVLERYFGTKEEVRKALDKALASLPYIP